MTYSVREKMGELETGIRAGVFFKVPGGIQLFLDPGTIILTRPGRPNNSTACVRASVFERVSSFVCVCVRICMSVSMCEY